MFYPCSIQIHHSSCSLSLSLSPSLQGANKFFVVAHQQSGAYHTLELRPHMQFEITKDQWDSVSLSQLQAGTDMSRRSELVCLLLDRHGNANLYLVLETMTILKAHIKVTMPHNKRKASTVVTHNQAQEKFFQQTYELLSRSLASDWNHIKCVVIGSPEDSKFYDYLFEEAQRRDDKVLLENKKKFVKVKTSSSHKHALHEVLKDPSVQSLIKEIQASEEVTLLNRFYEVLNSDPLRAVYGYREVLFALENGAVDTLMVTNALFRSTDLNTRKKYVALVDKAKQSSGTRVRIFSSAHVSGERTEASFLPPTLSFIYHFNDFRTHQSLF
jgi:protein pelota